MRALICCLDLEAKISIRTRSFVPAPCSKTHFRQMILYSNKRCLIKKKTVLKRIYVRVLSWLGWLRGSRTLQGEWWAPAAAPQSLRPCRLSGLSPASETQIEATDPEVYSAWSEQWSTNVKIWTNNIGEHDLFYYSFCLFWEKSFLFKFL